jgi:hypothetical protein
MFWALFDQTNVEKFETPHPRFNITANTGKLMFAIYLIIVVLVGVNMLIAMMNNSYEYVAVSLIKMPAEELQIRLLTNFALADSLK